MNEIQKQLVQMLLYGNSTETRLAKKALVKECDKMSRMTWHSKNRLDRKPFVQVMFEIYGKIFDAYEKVEIQNKTATLGFLSHALLFYETMHTHLGTFFVCVREALKDEKHGALRLMAVASTSNTRVLDVYDRGPYRKKLSKKAKETGEKYEAIMQTHLSDIFNSLETCIVTSEDDFPESMEQMKPSVMKSHLLYLFEIDRYDVLLELSGMYELEPFQDTNESYVKWRSVFQELLDTHPHIKKFITQVPRYDEYTDDEYGEDDLILCAHELLNESTPEGILSSEFFSGLHMQNAGVLPGYFSLPKEAYFELMDIVGDVSYSNTLRSIGDIVLAHARRAPVAEIYWYDVVDSICELLNDVSWRIEILSEAVEKMKSKIDVNSPIHQGEVNSIHYGIYGHRPVFRILLSYAIYHHHYGDKDTAKQYYEFLLALNPHDNQGVRYLLAALCANKPPTYVDELVEKGNKTQNWSEVDGLLREQNELYHFWKESTE